MRTIFKDPITIIIFISFFILWIFVAQIIFLRWHFWEAIILLMEERFITRCVRGHEIFEMCTRKDCSAPSGICREWGVNILKSTRNVSLHAQWKALLAWFLISPTRDLKRQISWWLEQSTKCSRSSRCSRMSIRAEIERWRTDWEAIGKSCTNSWRVDQLTVLLPNWSTMSLREKRDLKNNQRVLRNWGK